MPMRAIRFPGDLLPLTDILMRTFQYPDHPEWGIREDEQQDVLRTINSLRRLWPVIRVLQFFSPALRDLFRGFLWEEEGQIVGLVLCSRQGTTKTWEVDIVGVVPEYRGQGIARRLLTRALEDLRDRGADKAVLGVIDRNVPAYSLYTSVGFEPFGGMIEFEAKSNETPRVPPLPDGYGIESVRRSKSWRFQYELDKRIAPPEMTRYQPVVIGRYRPPLLLRPVVPLLRLLQRREVRFLLVRRSTGGPPIALARYSVPKREGGVNSIRVQLDPEHPRLADHLVVHHLERAIVRGPGRRVDLIVPSWMSAVADAADRCGFERRVQYHQLGLTL